MRFSTRIYWAIVNLPTNEGMWYGTSQKRKIKAVQFVYDFLIAVYSIFTGSARHVNSSERIVEIPFVLQNLSLEKGAKILDLGCDESKLSIELASLGYAVTGVDLNPYPYTHPNFTFVQGNFLEMGFDDERFDAVIALSSIEHFGLGAYGDRPSGGGDRQVVDRIYRLLKIGGQLLLTTPFGKRAITPHSRIYDWEQLQRLLNNFKIKKAEYYATEDLKHWSLSSKELLSKVDFHGGYIKGVVCCLCEKE